MPNALKSRADRRFKQNQAAGFFADEKARCAGPNFSNCFLFSIGENEGDSDNKLLWQLRLPLQITAQMKNVLVTGFEPFGGETINPSALAAQALDGRVTGGAQVTGMVLPCVFGKSLAALEEQIRLIQPDLVICAGLDKGSRVLTLERLAINIDDAIIPDNAGNQPVDQPVIYGGPAAYWSSLPIKAIVEALRKAGIPASVSQSAGTYVCNHVFYGLMSMLAWKPSVRGGFVHVPCVPEQAGEGSPSLPLDEIVRGLEIAVETSLTTQPDLYAAGGAAR